MSQQLALLSSILDRVPIAVIKHHDQGENKEGGGGQSAPCSSKESKSPMEAPKCNAGG